MQTYMQTLASVRPNGFGTFRSGDGTFSQSPNEFTRHCGTRRNKTMSESGAAPHRKGGESLVAKLAAIVPFYLGAANPGRPVHEVARRTDRVSL